MECFTPIGGFQLPIQRRLSRLYNDTKKSSDFVREPIQNDERPEMKSLHRKLRIQKDRLVSWGLEWSDPNQSAEIDESLSKAGLSEVVGSIMSTIKDILAEAEPLWQSSKHVTSRPSPHRKVPIVQWDSARFEDLVRDLTASIDTLYDLSRTRSSDYFPRRMSKTTYKSQSTDESRPFESSRRQTPQQINPENLTHLRSKQQDDAAIPLREVVFMSKTAYSELTQGSTTREPWAPLLLEYATFDSIYSVTGVMPPMSRFEKLSSALQQEPQRAPGTWTGLPRLLGYFEDIDNSRIGLVYRFPASFNHGPVERLTQHSLYSMPTLRDLLTCQEEPPLEAKFRMAYNLTNTIFDMHARGVTHGNLTDSNISFGEESIQAFDGPNAEIDVRRPLVSSFDLFPEDGTAAQISPWRHPLDPRTLQSSLGQSADERILELYSLGMVLLSIGLWTKLETLWPDPSSMVIPGSTLERLATRCGTLYMKAVQACWDAVDNQLNGKGRGEALLSMVQMQASRFLETCCILDGVSGLEQRLNQELREVPSAQHPAELSEDAKSPACYPAKKEQDNRRSDSASETADHAESAEADAGGKQKMKLYPQVSLSPDIVDKWNTILMPQIDQALRHFYRKHSESVEISLESVGPSPHATQPTVLVICTSVGKVRAILKKRLGELFDGTTGFGLKVCRGHVLRSRRHSKPVIPSMARKNSSSSTNGGDQANGDGEVAAVNPAYQERPGNGASIGAWIGDRHLPPVSFGGLILVDDKPYGMTVHHMLDDPDGDAIQNETLRSSAGLDGYGWYAEFMESSQDGDDFAYELSDTESEAYSETDITSDQSDDDEDDEQEGTNKFEPGDTPGIEPGCGEGYIITQPALDDVEEGFYPCAETEDEDHLDTFTLGEMYASSGIRRKQAHGLTHEVDWALFQFADGRLPSDNLIPRFDDGCPNTTAAHAGSRKEAGSLRPTSLAPSSTLPGMEVQCLARTSGLQTGLILPTLTSVKIYGRCSPSHAYQVAHTPVTRSAGNKTLHNIPLGIPGDSGAWVVSRQDGRLCGHVLAWSQRKRVAYISPMDVLLLDVAATLHASEVRLPGGEPVVSVQDADQDQDVGKAKKDEDSDASAEDEEDEAAEMAAEMTPATWQVQADSSRAAAYIPSSSNQESPKPLRFETSGELPGLAGRLKDAKIGRTPRIGVSG
ncbi:uncharacterized protein UV8b_03351 [Ustilaginoidea virens]|uniref:HET-s/LopB domain-containing protein n=1 Tax=Ustilaginoidea virens TaxID=1159556 RepID=A0A8E5HPQ4_USTVR|nr:uncharacterized protein UV8b_03351 [Ustilaginoidea virens]QUC19110.1 hypothetical protein UV8b_03351 [Ustilaginoidea virens]